MAGNEGRGKEGRRRENIARICNYQQEHGLASQPARIIPGANDAAVVAVAVKTAAAEGK